MAIGQEIRCFGWHWATWVAFCVTALVLTLIVVPGVYVTPTLLETQPFMWGGSFATAPPDPNLAKGPLSVVEYEHGWPWTYVRRAKGFGGVGWPKRGFDDEPYSEPLLTPGGIIVWWSAPDAWPIGSQSSRWYWLALGADAVVALSILSIVTVLTERWVQVRGGFGRFRLIELFVLSAAIAAALGWWRYNTQQTEINQAALDVLKSADCIEKEVTLVSQGAVAYRGRYWEYTGPDWLRRLVGSPEFLRSCCYRVTKLAIDSNKMGQLEWKAVTKLRDLDDIWVYGAESDIPPSVLNAFGHLDDIRQTRRSGGYSGADPHLDFTVITSNGRELSGAQQ